MIWGIVLLLIMALVFGPMLWVRYVMRTYSTEIAGMPGTGGELAKHLVERFGLQGVTIEVSPLGDHYDPSGRKIGLSEDNYHQKSLTAVAVAAHEVGHAIQHHQGDAKLAARTSLAPWAERLARLSSGVIWAGPVVSILTQTHIPLRYLVLVGMSGLVARMLMHLVTLPTEWDASFGKALPVLVDGQYIAPGEEAAVRKILRAAAFTYFAAALADILNLVRWAAMLLRGLR
ncbi:MAG: zinc metallopeptidase [Pseudomonadota bacterium]